VHGHFSTTHRPYTSLFRSDIHATEKDGNANAGHVFRKSFVFFRNLKCKFSRVTHNKNGNLVFDRIDLLQGGKNKDGRLAHTRLGDRKRTRLNSSHVSVAYA